MDGRHGVVDVRGWMDASDQPSSGVATRPSYSLQVNIGRTGKMRDIRLECGYSAKQLVDLLGYVSVFFHFRLGCAREAKLAEGCMVPCSERVGESYSDAQR